MLLYVLLFTWIIIGWGSLFISYRIGDEILTVRDLLFIFASGALFGAMYIIFLIYTIDAHWHRTITMFPIVDKISMKWNAFMSKRIL